MPFSCRLRGSPPSTTWSGLWASTISSSSSSQATRWISCMLHKQKQFVQLHSLIWFRLTFTCFWTSVPDPVCFWASWIRIRHCFVRIWILPSASKHFCKPWFLLTDFLSLKTDVNVPTESTGNKQNKFRKNFIYVGILEVTDEKRKIPSRILKSGVQIQGSESLPKCRGSGTLVWTPFLWKNKTTVITPLSIEILVSLVFSSISDSTGKKGGL